MAVADELIIAISADASGFAEALGNIEFVMECLAAIGDARREAGKYRMLYEASEADNERLAERLDLYTEMIAHQATLGAEMEVRMAWYRKLLHEDGHGALSAKRGHLQAAHRLNGES